MHFIVFGTLEEKPELNIGRNVNSQTTPNFDVHIQERRKIPNA